MSSAPTKSSAGSERLHQAIAAFLEAERSGKPVDRAAWLRDNADCAAELAAFFRDHDLMQSLAAPDPTLPPTHRSVMDTPTLAPSGMAEPSAPDMIRYFGDYELLQEIARGGMGVVYRARQTRLHRIVAIKMILTGQLASADDVRRFQVEAEAAANLEHPAIVPIFEIGMHLGQHYFSMGFVDGQSLAARLADGPLPAREAAQLLQTVAEAVHYAHGRGVIHRDLKPANILLDKSGQPRITDFGLAKRVSGDHDLTATGQILGTPSYMPPEQAAGLLDQVRERSDVYSLGAILYAVLTGRPPFQADNPLDTLLQVLAKEPVPPRQLNPKVPAELEVICLKCLEKDQPRRYATAQALADDLGRYLRGEPIQARPAGRIERSIKWARRNPLAAALAGVTLLGLAAVMATLLVSNVFIREEQRKTQSALLARTAALDDRTAALDREKKTSYYRTLALAQAELNIHEVGKAETLLEQCPEELRDWGWRFLKRTGEGNEQTFKVKSPSSAVFHPDGERLFSAGWDGRVRAWKVKTGEVLKTLSSGVSVMGSQGTSVRPGLGKLGDVLRTLNNEPLMGFDRLAISGDGKYLAASCVDRRIFLWNAKTYEAFQPLVGHSERCWDLAFSPDNRWLATASDDGTARIWDIANGRTVHIVRAHQAQVSSVAFHLNGDQLATCSWDRTAKLWQFDPQSGQSPTQPLAVFPLSHRGRLVRFHPRRQELAVVDDDKVITVWDLKTRRERFHFHEDYVNAMDYSPDGVRIITSSYSMAIRSWDSATGDETMAIRKFEISPLGVAFSPDGNRLATLVGDSIRVLDARPLGVAHGQLVLAGHTRMVKSLAFEPSGKRLVSASEDRTLRVWDVDPESTNYGTAVRTLEGHTAGVYPVTVSSNGTWIASGGEDQTVRIWDAQSGELLKTIPGLAEVPTSVAFDRAGTRLFATLGDAAALLWDTHSWQQIRTFGQREGWIHGGDLSPDGAWAVASRFDGLVHLYDARTGHLLKDLRGQHQHATFGFRPCFSADSKLLACPTGAHGAVTVWSVPEKGKILWTFESQNPSHTMAYSHVAFSPDNRLLAAAAFRGSVDVWDLASGKFLGSIHGPPGNLWCVVFSPDGKRLAIGGGHRTSGEIRVVDWERYVKVAAE